MPTIDKPSDGSVIAAAEEAPEELKPGTERVAPRRGHERECQSTPSSLFYFLLLRVPVCYFHIKLKKKFFFLKMQAFKKKKNS